MDLGLTFETNLELNKQKLFIEVSDILHKYFALKQYGMDIEHFYLGVISVRPEFEQFFKVRKPRYQAVSKVNLLDGNIKEQRGVFTYDIKLNFEELECATDEESRKILAKEILNSLSYLDALPKKVKDFDKEQFKSDMHEFFKEQNLI